MMRMGIKMKTINKFWACVWTLCILTVAVVAGAQVPGVFSSISWSSAVGTSILTNYASVNSAPAGVVSTSAGYTGWGKNSTGDMDFVAANNGASPSFYWWYLLGSSQVAEMWLDTSANLHVTNGITAATLSATTAFSAPHYTVATLPSAATAGAGGLVVVSDGNGTIGTCGGGGSTYMIAVSNGSSWICR